MVKSKKTFALGDLVFAKVKGYKPWPAKVSKCRNFDIKICGLYFFFLHKLYNKKCYNSN